MSKQSIVSVGVGSWYPKGIDRLEKSLHEVGYKGNFTGHKKLWDKCPTHDENPYAFKLYAIGEQYLNEFHQILWCDASLYAVKHPQKIFEKIKKNGVFGFRTGFNVANTATDEVLLAVDMTRDEAETIPEIATGCIGLNFEEKKVADAVNLWYEYMIQGLFINSRLHDNQSSDKRFMFGRQDQTMWSIALHKTGIEVPQSDLVAYYEAGKSGNEIFLIHGM